MQTAPVAPIQATDDKAITSEPKPAPSEKPAYMKEAFRDKATAACVSPTVRMSRSCCGGKKLQALKPHVTINGAMTGKACGANSRAPTVSSANVPAHTGREMP